MPQPTNFGGHSQLYSGNAAADNALLFTATDVLWADAFLIMSTVGTVDVEVTIDGTNWTPAAIAMRDLAATASATWVVVTTVNKAYEVIGKFAGIRVRQAGVTAATAHMRAYCR